jgi:phage terminase small subunit
MPRPLTPRQRLFVDAYLRTRNASLAAQEAGYAWPRACGYGSELLKQPHIAAALRERGLDPPRGVHPQTQIRKHWKKRPRTGLSLYEERFALAYLACGNATQAARRAGIKTIAPQVAGCKLLHRPTVAAFIEAERAASIERTRIDVDRVKREYARLAFSDIANIATWTEDEIALLPSDAISADDRAAIAVLRVKPSKNGLKATVRLHSKQHALDRLAKLLGLFDKKPAPVDPRTGDEARRELRERLLRIARGGKDEKEDESG